MVSIECETDGESGVSSLPAVRRGGRASIRQVVDETLGALRAADWLGSMGSFLGSASEQEKPHVDAFDCLFFRGDEGWWKGCLSAEDDAVFESGLGVEGGRLEAKGQEDGGERLSFHVQRRTHAPSLELALQFGNFFPPTKFVRFLHGFAACVSPPDTELRRSTSADFPTLIGLLTERVFETRGLRLVREELIEGEVLERVCVHARVDLFGRLAKHYPGLMELLRRFSELTVDVSDSRDELSLAHISWDASTRIVTVDAFKKGANLVWSHRDMTMPVLPLRPFSFDLSTEEPLTCHVSMHVTALGIAFQLPKLTLFVETVGRVLDARITSIETTFLCQSGAFFIGCSDLFDLLVESFRMRLELSSEGRLDVAAALKLPHSAIVAAYARRRIPHYVKRWLGVLKFFSDVCSAATQDLLLVVG